MWQKWDEADRRSSSPSYRSPQLFSPLRFSKAEPRFNQLAC